ncbi:MAG TPA: substrate-binding domain-containing protein [Vicinamibacterales bacterium]|nr:substrate-binding domain-containing protein [Vicinamibacterales bacterium]
MITRLSFAGLVVTLAMVPPIASARTSDIKLLSAIGMRQVMLELGPTFERTTGHTLSMSFDSTGVIAKRVASGEQVDVVLINESALGALVKDAQVTASSVTPVAAAVAAVAVRSGAPTPDISTPQLFKRMLLAAKSIARPSPAVGGSSGDHIVKVLAQLGITDEVNAKSVIVMTGLAGQIADSPGEAVAQGKADVALHQLQELMAVAGLQIVGPFPGTLQGNFTFAAAIGTKAANVSGATALIRFLQTAAAKAVISVKGMEPR